MIGYLCTIIAMKFYKLDKNTMADVAKKNSDIRK